MNQNLKKTIDKMVAESIRRLLPEIMNEVLLKTIANSGVLTEAPRRATSPPPPPQRKPAKRPSMSMVDLLEEDAGSEFYRQEEAPPPPPVMSQRITSLPPELQELAADSVSAIMQEDEVPTVDLNRSGFDFSRMRQAMGLVEQRASKPVAKDPTLEAARIERQRKMLDSKIVG